jgi:hypothetical protein
MSHPVTELDVVRLSTPGRGWAEPGGEATIVPAGTTGTVVLCSDSSDLVLIEVVDATSGATHACVEVPVSEVVVTRRTAVRAT